MREKNRSPLTLRIGPEPPGPERTCIGCMQRDEQATMVRIGVVDGRVTMDLQDRQRVGRGGYLHRRDECVERFVNSKVKEFRSLRRKIDREERLAIAGAIKLTLDREREVE